MQNKLPNLQGIFQCAVRFCDRTLELAYRTLAMSRVLLFVCFSTLFQHPFTRVDMLLIRDKRGDLAIGHRVAGTGEDGGRRTGSKMG